MTQIPNERHEHEEEVAEAMTPEEVKELESLLADYMTDGKIDFEKAKADSHPVDLDKLIAAEKKRNGV
jgi:hypothetical protein